MPVQKFRRLDLPAAQTLYQRITAESLSCAYSERELDELVAHRPDLVVEQEGCVLGAIRHGDTLVLPYAFADARAFTDHFEAMFARLLPRARKAYRPDTVRFRLSHGPSRPRVEPVLRRLSFEPARSWLQFELTKPSRLPAAPLPRGVTVREASPGDVDAALAIDRECFPATPVTREGMQEALDSGTMLIAERKGVAVGFALYSRDDASSAYLRTLAVIEDARAAGIGAALTMRVARNVFAASATSLGLRTEEDNAGAIRLYTRLGFKHAGAGRDYERPADPKVIERLRREGEGTFIKFGGWR